MALEWFRMYSEFASDPKVQSMTEPMQRRLIMVLCLRCSNTLVTLHDDEIAFALRISEDELAQTKSLFIKKGFVNDAWEVMNWDKRQFASDSSAARVARHREAKRQAQKQPETHDVTGGNVTVTPQIQNRTDTEQIQKQSKEKPLSASPPDGYPEEFEEIWQAYPPRPGASKKDSYKAWAARRKEGVTAEDLLAGVLRYAQYVNRDRTAPKFVKQPVTFFGPGEHYKADWAIEARASPHSKHSGFDKIDYDAGMKNGRIE